MAVRSQLHSSPAGPRRRGPDGCQVIDRWLSPGKKNDNNKIYPTELLLVCALLKSKVIRQLSFCGTLHSGWTTAALLAVASELRQATASFTDMTGSVDILLTK